MRREDLTVAARGPVNRRVPVYTDATLLVPADLTGYSAAAQVRQKWDATAILYVFTVVFETGALRITAPAADTALWPAAWPSLTGVWDLVLTDSGGLKQAPLVGGQITVVPYVTHP